MRKQLSFALVALVALPALFLLACGGGDDGPGTPPADQCSLTVTQPAGGTQYLAGQDCRIRWTQEGSNSVQIDLLKGGQLVSNITTVQGREQYGWHATTLGAESGDDYTIRLSAVGDDGCGDTSDEFTILDTANCQFAFTFPDTAYLDEGQDFLVTWDSESTTGLVDIELWKEIDELDGPVGLIANDLADTGEFLWEVDSLHQGTYNYYYLVIRDDLVENCGAESSQFRINDENICTISVGIPVDLSPTNPLSVGDMCRIDFTAEDMATLAVNLSLYQGMVYVNTIGSHVPVTHLLDSVEWQVDVTGITAPSHTFRIKATDATDGNCVGFSGDFNITGF